MIVTVLSGAIRTNAFGAKTSSAASARRPSSRSPTSNAAPATAVDWTNRRRVSMISLPASRPPRVRVDVDGARSALGDPAAVLRPGQAELVAQHPQERHVGLDVDFSARAVDPERHHRRASTLDSGTRARTIGATLHA